MDRKKDDLQALGAKVKYSENYAPEVLETFENMNQENDYWVRFNCPEFTTLCPITGQTGFFTPRGGISIYPYANYGRPGTKWEELAEQRFASHE